MDCSRAIRSGRRTEDPERDGFELFDSATRHPTTGQPGLAFQRWCLANSSPISDFRWAQSGNEHATQLG
jgi:hypothetical protein